VTIIIAQLLPFKKLKLFEYIKNMLYFFSEDIYVSFCILARVTDIYRLLITQIGTTTC